MKCENCDMEHKGIYGSGRFCSEKCARSYSTKNNRIETNKKVSVSLRKTFLLKNGEHKKCEICNKEIRKNSASNRCRQHYEKVVSNITKEKLSIKRIEKIKEGYLNSPNKIKVYYKNLLIRCDSKLEVAALIYLKELGENNIERNTNVVNYSFGDSKKNFLPDFITENYLIEVKSVVGNFLNDKWNLYKEQIPFKKKALEEKSKELNKTPLWLDKTNKKLRKIYDNFLGKNILEFYLE